MQLVLALGLGNFGIVLVMVGAVYFLGLVAATLTAAQDTNQPLFSYETNALTDGTLKSLIASTPGAAANDALFAFDDARISTLDRLKSGACQVFPGGADWPSQAVWHVFDKLLGEGALIETVPLAAPCYQNLVVFSTEKCAAVRSGWADPYLQYSFYLNLKVVYTWMSFG